MPAATRIGDETTGVCDAGFDCCPHDRAGTNTGGSPDVFINGIAAHRKTDAGGCNCPHGGTFQSTAGSTTVFINGLPATRVGDETTCQSCGQTGTHTDGSGSVFIG